MTIDTEFVSLIADGSAKLFDGFATPDVWRAAERGEGFAALWERIEASGYLDVLTAEDANAATRGAAACAVIVNAGRALVPAPVGETIVARALMSQAGHDQVLGPIAIGKRRAAYGRYAQARLDCRPHGLSAGTALDVAHKDVNVAGEPRDDLEAWQTTWRDVDYSADRFHACGALVRAAQMAGAVERSLMLTVDYARTRKQFGKPIGQFQAIQQNLAILAGHAAAAATAAAHAFRRWDHQDFVMLTAAAKIRSGEAAGAAIAIAHQTHGAIGITHEHELHFATRRLHAWRAEFGGESYWSRALGRWAGRLGPDDLWAAITRS